MPSMLVAALCGGLLVACCWAVHAAVLHRRLGTWRTDPVSGLPVRHAFARGARRALRRPGRAVLVIDLDGFKSVNDRFGHHAGDQVLAIVGARLRTTLGRSAVLGRLGGDEFAAVMAVGAVDTPWLDPIVALDQALRAPIRLPDLSRPIRVGVSIGVVHLNGMDRVALPVVLHRADRAMYEAKHRGGGIVATTADVADASWRRAVSRRPGRRQRHTTTQPGRSGQQPPGD